MENHISKYNERSLWRKIKKFAMKAGQEVIGRAMVLYYCLQDPDTPIQAKTIILGALGYFIAPIDAIPDITPGVGFTDDLGALAIALVIVAVHIKAEHRKLANIKLKTWFGESETNQDTATT